MFSAFNPSKCTHTGRSGPPGSSWGFGALLKGLISVMDTSCQSRDSNPQPRVTSLTLYPLGHDCIFMHLCFYAFMHNKLSMYYSILMERSYNDCQCSFVMFYSFLCIFGPSLMQSSSAGMRGCCCSFTSKENDSLQYTSRTT